MNIEIKQAAPNCIDIFYRGNLVISKSGTVVIITEDSSYYNISFSGVSLSNTNQPLYAKEWNKESFKQFHGTIKLES